MEQELKIITFLTLSQSLFDNELKGIVKSNCIDFYHFLLDGLEKKRDRFLAEDDEKFLVYDAIIGLLENFPQLPEQEISDLIKYQNSIIEFLVEKTALPDLEIKAALLHLRNDVLIKTSLFLSASK